MPRDAPVRMQVQTQREGAQRPDGVGGDARRTRSRYSRWRFEQQRRVALGQISSLFAERAPPRWSTKASSHRTFPIAGSGCARAEVVLFAVTQPEPRVETADRVYERAADVEAESHAGGKVGIRRHRRELQCRHQRRGVVRFRPRVIGAEARQRADLGVVRKRRDGADLRIGRGAALELVEPASRHDRVRVEKHDVGPRARFAHAAIRRQRKAEIALVREEPHLRQVACAQRGKYAPTAVSPARHRRSAASAAPPSARGLSTQRARSPAAL